MKSNLHYAALCMPLLFTTLNTNAQNTVAKSDEQSSAKRPNIIFILADDAGYADFGFQGSKQFRTPNLDKLAKSGVQLNQLYTTDAVSGPSRAGLLTGRYQQRFGIEENAVSGYMVDFTSHSTDMGVPTEERFISDYLHDAGYTCAVFGKWHLGGDDCFHPLRRGFDHFVGFRSGGRSYFPYPDDSYFQGDGVERKLEYGFGHFKEPEYYMTDVLGDETCEFIEENANSDKPFFIYLAFNAVHSPLDVDPEDMKLFPELKGNRRKLAAMTWAMDEACGKVVDKLKELGLDENTIIVFGSDNGGPNTTNTSNYPLSGMKATFLEGGIRVPGFVSYPGVIKPNTTYDKAVSYLDFLPTFVTLSGDASKLRDNLDGVDIMPYLTGEKEGAPHETLYWKCENRGALLDGDWKFMRFPDRPAELYDLSKDISEQKNLAAKNPELIKKYYQMLSDWEMTLERPRWMLQRKYEKRVLQEYYYQDDYRYPKEQK